MMPLQRLSPLRARVRLQDAMRLTVAQSRGTLAPPGLRLREQVIVLTARAFERVKP